MRNLNLLLLALIPAALAALASAQQEPPGINADRAAAAQAAERLEYKIQWDPPWFFFFLPRMEAGEVSVELINAADYRGREAHKIVFKANSSGTLTRMAGVKVEDEFVFYTEPETFCTLSASEKIREGKRRRQIDVQYLSEARQLHIHDVDEAAVPPKVRKDETKALSHECVHDPLSALYLFRNLPLRDQLTHTFVLANDDKIREVRGVVEKQEMVDTSAGKTAAWRVSTAALMGNLFKEGGQFRVWFSTDERKVPIQFEVKVRLGRVFGKLKSAD